MAKEQDDSDECLPPERREAIVAWEVSKCEVRCYVARMARLPKYGPQNVHTQSYHVQRV